MHDKTTSKANAQGLRIGIAVSRYHGEITTSMCDAAQEAFVRSGGAKENLTIVKTAGAFELTAVCRGFAALESRTGRPGFDAALALGCIISGETTHDQYLAQSVTQGLTAITVETGMPIGFGVLTCQSYDQAKARSIGAAASGGVNKGAEAMLAAIETVNALRAISSSRGVR